MPNTSTKAGFHYNQGTYSGWTNRETWAAHLWITNEEDLYLMALQTANSEMLEDWIDEMFDLKSQSEKLTTMFDDIGSLWRVNWGEIYDAIQD
tara:strand:+ start:333 stop:611 length:279 start_codon:yes stop_codon:yes gene_type:complete